MNEYSKFEFWNKDLVKIKLLKFHHALLKTIYCFPLVYFFPSLIDKKVYEIKTIYRHYSCQSSCIPTYKFRDKNPKAIFLNPEVISR